MCTAVYSMGLFQFLNIWIVTSLLYSLSQVCCTAFYYPIQCTYALPKSHPLLQKIVKEVHDVTRMQLNLPENLQNLELAAVRVWGNPL